ncbi:MULTISPECIES: hypothetical protein [unclassified Polaromonas]|jgi:hypothetical protein|nr:MULTISPECIES: hypothetical protein [unclassified Polaromonas]OYY32058.1 MAG: hypothetical protein B7Y60_23425 [Polaromonas sp. 35-63-35]OYZ15120.1 MAG: hypothetical protein B7Y28_22590 [Polaromonas sp. 16-63-31]OYZ75505.1 MAG: hypothetical protein B7Y09_23980 [Polaromonas sp. 24-63-21]OZA53016.1 MAG: hypothetical protein B7X88_03705 [Polaromonas sp. 17-63-33]OZA85476.1 MAG: hypothetical protein B7X65_21715 [Polaromonas sp. 39-63-25]
MKLVFIYGNRFNSRLTKLFTDSTCYHVGFTDGVKFWDMNLIRRRRLWPLYPAERTIVVECPVPMTAEYLDRQLDTDESHYGVLDYLLFGLRGLYHLVGKSTRNAGGVICSEMVANDLAANGWDRRFVEVPSPADLELVILGSRDALRAKQLEAASVAG